MEREPELVSGVFLVNEKNELLLVRGPKFTSWVVPGGHVDFGESLEDCAKRELKEETGLTCDKLTFISINEDLHKVVKDRERHFVFVNFFCKMENPQINLEIRELTQMVWVPLEKIKEYPEVPDSLKEPAGIILKWFNGS